MKKKLFIIVLLTALGMQGCGTEKPVESYSETVNEQETAEADNSQESETKTEVETEVEVSSEQSNLVNIYKVPGRNIYVEGPDYQEIEEGYTEIFIVHDVKYTAITAEVFMEQTLSPGSKATHFFSVKGIDTTTKYESIFYVDKNQYDNNIGDKIRIGVREEKL